MLANKPEHRKLLMDTGTNVDARNYGFVRDDDCCHGYADVVNALLHGDAVLSLQESDKQALLHHAAAGGHLEIVKTLVHFKVPLNIADKQGFTPLHLAIINAHEEIALFLVDNGASVNKQDSKGNAPLHLAVQQSYIEVIKALIAQGCNKDVMNKYNESPIYTAVKIGNVRTLLVLVKLGCRADLLQPNGATAIHSLVTVYNSDYPAEFRTVLEILLYGGCDINTPSYGISETPLFKAMGFGKAECVEVLLAYGADPNIPGSFEMTALRLAHKRKLASSCDVLLQSGINWQREIWQKNVPLNYTTDPNTVLGKCSLWRKQPISLLNLSRIAFRKHCGKDLHRILVKRSDIPHLLKNYILFNDIKPNKYDSFLSNFGRGSWVNSILDEEISYGPFKARNNLNKLNSSGRVQAGFDWAECGIDSGSFNRTYRCDVDIDSKVFGVKEFNGTDTADTSKAYSVDKTNLQDIHAQLKIYIEQISGIYDCHELQPGCSV